MNSSANPGSSKTGRNASCPCGSGKKYKRCCGSAPSAAIPATGGTPLPPGRFSYEPGSYGRRDACVPSILCKKESGEGSWQTHFVLVKPDQPYESHEEATAAAEGHLAAARKRHEKDGVLAFAAALKTAGYVRVTDPRYARDYRNILEAVEYIQQCATDLRAEVVSYSEWVLFATKSGDAWLLQPADALAVRLSEGGKAIPAKVGETAEHYTIDFETHYRIEGDAFLFAGPDEPERAAHGYPVEDIRKASP